MNTERFFSSVSAASGGASVESFIELWNPIASKKAVKVTAVKINTKATLVSFMTHTAQQAASGVAGKIANKNIGGNASVCTLYGYSLLFVLGTVMIEMITAADTALPNDLSISPFIVKPGQSFMIANQTSNSAINAVHLAWQEVDENF